ncbi:hypothetical protein [Haloarchaeobius sp. DT45]|uniref:hypothetical protein n=1 Tax=Haloarchaeobius sp. DT45 TaxID=3446116 RepID=UPI003F6B11B5
MTDTDFSVYGMKLQPGAAEAGTDPFEFCKQEGVVGVGWGLDRRQFDTLDEVIENHREIRERRIEQGKEAGRVLQDGRLNAALRHVLENMEPGDFVWVNEKNKFALCKIESDWAVSSNLSDEEFERFHKRDIQNFRHVDWVDIPYSLVPGYVRRKFSRPFGTLKRMNTGIDEDSKQVILALHSQGELASDRSLDREQIAKKLATHEPERVFNILGSDETEDIVISYLQSEGWRIIKSSTSSSQADIECEMRKERHGQSVAGYLQVKTGDASLDPDTYEKYSSDGEMIFFVQSGVDVENHNNMSALAPKKIYDYMVSDYNYLPSDSLLKLDFALSYSA